MKSIFSHNTNINKPEFEAAACHFTISCAASRAHTNLMQIALNIYGSHGALISGCVRDHFPEIIKDELRALSRKVSYHMDLGMECRPPRIRNSTMRDLGRYIANRDGSGYYGFSSRL